MRQSAFSLPLPGRSSRSARLTTFGELGGQGMPDLVGQLQSADGFIDQLPVDRLGHLDEPHDPAQLNQCQADPLCLGDHLLRHGRQLVPVSMAIPAAPTSASSRM